LRITSGNVADITQAEALLKQLRGLVVADAAYISASLRQKLSGLLPTFNHFVTDFLPIV
jgi:hypothetical protein